MKKYLVIFIMLMVVNVSTFALPRGATHTMQIKEHHTHTGAELLIRKDVVVETEVKKINNWYYTFETYGNEYQYSGCQHVFVVPTESYFVRDATELEIKAYKANVNVATFILTLIIVAIVISIGYLTFDVIKNQRYKNM
mgnify:CR=1 FL=1